MLVGTLFESTRAETEAEHPWEDTIGLPFADQFELARKGKEPAKEGDAAKPPKVGQ